MKITEYKCISDFNNDSLEDVKEAVEKLIEKFGSEALLCIDYVDGCSWTIEFKREETNTEREERLKYKK